MEYNIIFFKVKKLFNLSYEEYAIAYTVYILSNNENNGRKWCYCSKEFLSESLDISRSSVFMLLKKLIDIGVIIKYANTKYLKTSPKWNDSILREQNQLNNSRKKEKENTEKIEQKFVEESIEYKAADYLLNKISINVPGYKKPNMQKWASVFYKIFNLDKREKSEVREIIDWSQAHEFWKSNILSPEKLRSKYDTLNAQKISEDEKNGTRKASKGYVSNPNR